MHHSKQPLRFEIGLLVGVISAILLLIGLVAASRNFMNFGTETDFILVFVPDAQRFLDGAPLQLRFHPPLYPIVIAVFRGLTGDWFIAGRVVSWIAAALCMGIGSVLLHRLYGRAAAAGGLLAFIGSGLFISFSAMATSDVFSLALFYASILCALIALRRAEHRWWFLSGVLLGLCLLTRSNAVTLVLLLGFPLLSTLPWKRRALDAARLALGCALPVLLWFGYATITDSVSWPSGGLKDNLALTYFADREAGVGAEAMNQVKGRFDSLFDVLTHDPVRLVTTYLRDSRAVAHRTFRSSQLLEFPLNLLTLPGLFFLAWRSRSAASRWFLLMLLAQLALVNLKTYEARFHLFMLPALGAGVGLMIEEARRRFRWQAVRVGLLLATLLLVGFVAFKAGMKSWTRLHAQDEELSAAVSGAQPFVTTTTRIIARKPHVAYYTGGEWVYLANRDLDELRAAWSRPTADATTLVDDSEALLYVGSQERRRRKALAGLIESSAAPRWLTPLARGDAGGGWVLYRVTDSRPVAGSVQPIDINR